MAYAGEDGEVAIFKERMLQDNRTRRPHTAVAGQLHWSGSHPPTPALALRLQHAHVERQMTAGIDTASDVRPDSESDLCVCATLMSQTCSPDSLPP